MDIIEIKYINILHNCERIEPIKMDFLQDLILET
jgi:hypothetical protein